MPKTYKGERIYCATDIKKMLAMKHRGDLFFTEVKDGPTQMVTHHARIDALAMPISWTRFQITGYEVKVARGDFLRDDKWQAYLPMCNQLYFAVAPGVCDVSEVPECCGLMQVTGNGALRTVKKAPWREIETPVNMLLYLLFSYADCKSGRPRAEEWTRDARVENFQKYLEDKIAWREIGHHVSGKIREEMSALRIENSRMKLLYDKEKTAEQELDAICKALNVRASSYNRCAECLKAIEALEMSGLSPTVTQAAARLQADAEALLRALETRDGGQT